MSRPINQNGSVVLLPNGFNNTVGSYHFTTSSSYPLTNMYTDSSHTSSYTRLTLASNKNSSRKSEAYLLFDKSNLDNIPEEGTITGVSCKIRYAVGSTTYVSALSIQLASGTSLKGSTITTRSTTNSTSGGALYTVNGMGGNTSWTRSELQDIQLYISATHNTSTSSGYLYIYGSDITISYNISGTEYEITITNNSSITVTPASGTYVFQGRSQDIILNTTDVSSITVTDNGSNITLSPIYEDVISSTTFYPSSHLAGVTSYTTNPTNAYHSSSNTSSYAQLRSSSNTQYTTSYYFDLSSIPNNARNITIACSIRGKVQGTGDSYTGKAQLRCDKTLRGTSVTVTSTDTDGAIYQLNDSGSWTRSELDDLNLFLSHPIGGSNRYFYFYGADLTVTYSVPGTSGTIIGYKYTISNISSDHTIIISSGPSQTIYVKVNGGWVACSKVYKKVNGSWVEQTDFTNLFDSNKIYIKV